MGVNLGSAYGEIILDATGAQTGIKTAQGALEGFQNTMGNIGAKMQDVGKKMTVGVTAPLVLLGKKAISAGSDLTESMNKVEVVFGDAADSVLAWSTTTDTAMGQSQQQALEAAGTFGNLFDSIGLGDVAAAEMSMSLVGLASDLASFNNIDPSVALEKLRSGLVGEVEPLRVLGINLLQSSVQAKAMEMGLAGVASELTQQDMLQARYALILEQSSNAQGDFARTSDGLANSQRILKAQWEEATATLGMKLQPMMLDLVHTLGGLLEKFMALPDPIQNTILVVAGLAAAAGPVLVVLGSLATVIGAVSAPVLALVAAVGLLGAAWATNFMGIRDVTAEVWERVQEAVQTAIEFVRPYIEEFVTTVRAWWDENWPAIQATFEQVWNAILSVVQYVVGLVGPFITETFGQVVGWVQANWPLILQTIQTVLDAVWGVVQTVLGAIEQFWTDHGEKIKTVVETAWEIVKTVITTALATIGDVIKAVMQAINGDWEGAWETIKGAAERIWEAIGTVIENAIEVIETTVAIVWETIQPKLIEAWNAIQTKTSEVWSAVVGAVEGAWAKLSPVLDAIAGGFGWVTGAIDAVKGAINGFIGAMANLAGIEVPSWLQIHSPPELAQGFTMIGEAASFAGAQISGAFGAGVLELSTGGILAFVESLKKLIYAWEGMFKTKQEMRVLNQAVDMIKKWEDIGAGLKGAAEGLAALMGYSGGLMQKTVNQFISDTMMVINGLLDYVESGVKRAAAIADRFGQSLSIITGAISMLDTLRDYTGPAKEQLDEFGVDLFDITQIIVDLAAHFDQYAVEAAAVFSESAGTIGESVGQAVGGLIDVAGYAGATPMAFMQLRNDLHTAVTMMEGIAAEFEIEGVEAAAAFSESAGVIATAVGEAVRGLTELAPYEGAGVLDMYGHYTMRGLWKLDLDLRTLLQVMQRLAEDFNGAGLEAAAAFSESVGVIASAMGEAVGGLIDVAQYSGATPVAFMKLRNDLHTAVTMMEGVAAEFEIEGVEAAAAFSASVGVIASAMGEAVGGLIDVAQYSGAPPMAFIKLRDDLHRVVTMMEGVAAEFEIEGVEAAAAFSESAGVIATAVGEAVGGLIDVAQYSGATPVAFMQLRDDLRRVVMMMERLAAEFEIEGVEAAAAFSESVGVIANAVGEAVGGLIDVAGYAGATPMAFIKLRDDLHRVVMMMERLAAEFKIEGVEAAAAFSESVGVIANAVGEAVRGLTELAGYKNAGKSDQYGYYMLKSLLAFELDLRYVVHMMQRLAEDYNGAGLEAAVSFAEAVNVIVNMIQDALRALIGIGEYEGLGSNLGTFIADLQAVIAELQALQVVMVDTSGLFAMTDSLFSAGNIGYPSSSNVTVNVDAAAADPWAVAELTASALRTEVRYS